MSTDNEIVDSNFMLTPKGREWIRDMLKDEANIKSIHDNLRRGITNKSQSIVPQFQNILKTEMPTRIQDMAAVLKETLKLTIASSLKTDYDTGMLLDMLEAISLNQVQLRHDLKEIVVAVSNKDQKERDNMLDYIEKRMEHDEKRIQKTLEVAKENANIIKWVKRDLADRSKVFNGET
jgi:16S rRNA C1402 (ribose-2'-O) methylase RsmI